MKYQDWLGQELKVGDTIVYATGAAGSSRQSLGVITKLSERQGWNNTSPSIAVRVDASSSWGKVPRHVQLTGRHRFKTGDHVFDQVVKISG